MKKKMQNLIDAANAVIDDHKDFETRVEEELQRRAPLRIYQSLLLHYANVTQRDDSKRNTPKAKEALSAIRVLEEIFPRVLEEIKWK